MFTPVNLAGDGIQQLLSLFLHFTLHWAFVGNLIILVLWYENLVISPLLKRKPGDIAPFKEEAW